MSEFTYVSNTKKRISFPLLNLLLFGLSFITCMIAGTQWAYKDFTEVLNWHYGITYAILILSFLSAHEFGHYFAAKYHKVDATLPYYLPFPFTFTLNFGTFGAVIKTRTPIPNKTALFDIGVAGPLAGFFVAVSFLAYGLINLPGIDYIYLLHPEYITQFGGHIPTFGLHFGDTLVYSAMVSLFANPNGFLPPMNEIYHYPFLNVGWFGLFVTTLNMLPMGQLDGGHITYAMFGEKTHSKIAKFTFQFLLFVGILSLVGAFHDFLTLIPVGDDMYSFRQTFLPAVDSIYKIYPPIFRGWSGWLVWAMIAKFFVKLKHPPILSTESLDVKRKILGWLALIILLLSFSFTGIFILE